MSIKASEISDLIQARIKNFDAATEARNVGTVVSVTDGICQWPDTADLLEDRLGPGTVAVADEDVEELLRRLATVGVEAKRD